MRSTFTTSYFSDKYPQLKTHEHLHRSSEGFATQGQSPCDAKYDLQVRQDKFRRGTTKCHAETQLIVWKVSFVKLDMSY